MPVQKHPLPQGEGGGEGGPQGDNVLILNPLILTFSLREKGYVDFLDGHYLDDTGGGP